MSINIDTCIENAAKNLEATNGTHPAEEIKARALTSIASSLLAIAAWNTRHEEERSRTDQHVVTADEGGETRYHKLFGTPERAARTMHGDTPLCDICELRGKPCDGCPLVEDYDALLEWMRGDAE